MPSKIWAVSSGKGGVGKTFVSSSLGITLTKLNYSVLIIDFDVSCANLHSTLGINPEGNSLKQFFNGEKKLAELVRATPIPRLSIVMGLFDQWATPDLTREHGYELIEQARKLDYDFVIIDQGPGALPYYLETFSRADERILVSTPEPTSVEKSYRFLESALWDFLSHNTEPENQDKLFKALGEYRQLRKAGTINFEAFLRESTGIQGSLLEGFNMRPVKLIINESRSRLDQDLGYSIKSVCKKYFDVTVDFIGAIEYDNAVWQSVRNREPFLVEKPFTPLSGQFLTMCKSLTTPDLHAQIFKAVV